MVSARCAASLFGCKEAEPIFGLSPSGDEASYQRPSASICGQTILVHPWFPFGCRCAALGSSVVAREDLIEGLLSEAWVVRGVYWLARDREPSRSARESASCSRAAPGATTRSRAQT